MKTIETAALAELIRKTSRDVDNGNSGTVQQAVAELREYVEPGCHVGKGDEMDGTDAGYRMQLEWYAGQLLSMIDEQAWFGINSWINCTEKFTTRKPS